MSGSRGTGLQHQHLEAEAEESEFKARLVYRANSRISLLHRETIFKNQQETNTHTQKEHIVFFLVL